MSLFRAVYVPFLAAVGVTFGIALGGTMVFCKPEGLIALDQQGLCSASDTPREVLVSFAVLGAMAGMTLLAAWTAVRLFAGGGKE